MRWHLQLCTCAAQTDPLSSPQEQSEPIKSQQFNHKAKETKNEKVCTLDKSVTSLVFLMSSPNTRSCLNAREGFRVKSKTAINPFFFFVKRI
jgi:hypothetical protein